MEISLFIFLVAAAVKQRDSSPSKFIFVEMPVAMELVESGFLLPIAKYIAIKHKRVPLKYSAYLPCLECSRMKVRRGCGEVVEPDEVEP